MSVPLFDTRTPVAPLRGEIDDELAAALKSPVLSREQAAEVVAAVRDARLGRPH